MLLGAIEASVLVLAGGLDDTVWLRILLVAAAAMSLTTLHQRRGDQGNPVATKRAPPPAATNCGDSGAASLLPLASDSCGLQW